MIFMIHSIPLKSFLRSPRGCALVLRFRQDRTNFSLQVFIVLTHVWMVWIQVNEAWDGSGEPENEPILASYYEDVFVDVLRFVDGEGYEVLFICSLMS